MMVRIQGFLAALLAALILVVPSAVFAGDASQAEIEALKKDIEQLRRQLAGSSTAMPRSSVDRMVEGKYGPNTSVTTRSGKLTIGGLLQVWYYSIQNDHNGAFGNVDTGILDTNEASDNDSFRIRRSEIKFTMDIHENVTAVVMIDPAREATSFPNMPDNKGLIKRVNNISPELYAGGDGEFGSPTAVGNVQTGAGSVPRLLQDAYINYHGVVPHHDFTVGQFKPKFGEEGPRSSTELDFVERSWVGQMNEVRDLGAAIHGFWWDDRFQYWLGAFDGAGNYFGSDGQAQNRSDTNDYKDFLGSLLVRPLWKNECWGSIELGYSFMGGKHGESGARDSTADTGTPLNGLNRAQNSALKHGAYAMYMPGGPVRGWWIKGEWAFIKDRNAPSSVIDIDNVAWQNGPMPTSTQGWYVATGYKMSDCCFCDCSPGFLKGFEFLFRYQSYGNVMVADRDNAGQTDVFKTQVYTAGVNYYIKGHNAKIQANYNVVLDPHDTALEKSYGLRGVKNDNFMVNFQVAF
jgi:phosphate-selective porin